MQKKPRIAATLRMLTPAQLFEHKGFAQAMRDYYGRTKPATRQEALANAVGWASRQVGK